MVDLTKGNAGFSSLQLRGLRDTFATTSGGGDVTLAGNNPFTGDNSFAGTTTLTGPVVSTVLPTLAANNVFTGTNTIPGYPTLAGNNTFTGTNVIPGYPTLAGNNTFTGTNTIPGFPTLSSTQTWTGTNTFGATTIAGATNINTTGTAATNIGTSASANTVTIGNAGSTLAINAGTITGIPSLGATQTWTGNNTFSGTTTISGFPKLSSNQTWSGVNTFGQGSSATNFNATVNFNDNVQMDDFITFTVNGSIRTAAVSGTTVSNAVTIDAMNGIITTGSLTTAAGASQAITLNNIFITSSTALIFCQLMGGTNTVKNINLMITSISSESAVITIYNNSPSSALNGTVIFAFWVLG